MEHANTKENIREQDSLPYLFNQLIEKEPKLVTNFVPADAMSQKEAFITGDIRNPSHQYPKLADMDFRDTYEVKWRLAALEKATEQSGIEDLDLAKIKNTAYGSTMRIFRGTDELPWFKDLSYYNGSAGVWRHLEEIRGDDVQFMFVLMGKSNPANIGHRRVMLETATR